MYRRTVLENGIRVVTDSMESVRSVAMGIIVDASPQDEAYMQSGLAHMVEHLMFQGTSNRASLQIARFMDEAGGQMGAFTTRDYTCYTATVLDDFQPYALDLMGDILLNSIFPESAIEREKNTIIREIESSLDIPPQRADALLKDLVWSDHPLGRLIAGNPKSVRNLTREDVIYFVHSQYLPDKIIIAAAGNLDHEDFVAQVRDAFWRLMGQSKPRPRKDLSYQPGVVIDHTCVNQVYFSMGIPAYPYTHADRYELHLLNKILGGGISSRLFRRIREELGLVYQIDSEYMAYRDGGLLVIEGSTTPEHLNTTLDQVGKEIRTLLNHDKPVNEEELLKAKNQIKGQHLITAENVGTRMSRLLTQEFYFGRHVDADEILEKIESVDESKLHQGAMVPMEAAIENAALALVGPEAPDSYSVSTMEAFLADFALQKGE